ASRVTIQGTKNVVDAAIQAGVDACVVVSTATVFGNPAATGPIDETFAYSKPSPALEAYGRAKAAAEKYALRRAEAVGTTRIAVIDPVAVYGPYAKLFASLPVLAAKTGKFGWIEGGKGKMNYV